MGEKMFIKANSAGQKAITELVDIALKTGGVQVLQGVSMVLNSIDVDNEFFEKEKKQKKNNI